MNNNCDPQQNRARRLRVCTSSVSYIGAGGQLVKRLGSSTADSLLTQLLQDDASPASKLSVPDFYSFAVAAQATLMVANGSSEPFSRICHCSDRGKRVSCLIQVEPYFFAQRHAGAKVTCLNVVAA
jgi:hypothetical protein